MATTRHPAAPQVSRPARMSVPVDETVRYCLDRIRTAGTPEQRALEHLLPGATLGNLTEAMAMRALVRLGLDTLLEEAADAEAAETAAERSADVAAGRVRTVSADQVGRDLGL